jgi:hypothetical protein
VYSGVAVDPAIAHRAGRDLLQAEVEVAADG